jgi:dihydroneopterin aldolase
MDRILVNGLKLKAIIGTFERERAEAQEVVLDLELRCDLKKAGRSDELPDTVDYFSLTEAVAKHVESSKRSLLESLAEDVAELCLGFAGVASVKVRIAKPAALPRAESAAIEIERP